MILMKSKPPCRFFVLFPTRCSIVSTSRTCWKVLLSFSSSKFCCFKETLSPGFSFLLRKEHFLSAVHFKRNLRTENPGGAVENKNLPKETHKVCSGGSNCSKDDSNCSKDDSNCQYMIWNAVQWVQAASISYLWHDELSNCMMFFLAISLVSGYYQTTYPHTCSRSACSLLHIHNCTSLRCSHN